ncbi:MAG: C-terminal binding protein [Nocardioides sp.]
MRVIFTDPPWALGSDGLPDPRRADLECAALEPAISVEFGHFADGRWSLSGPPLYDQVKGAEALVVYRCAVDPALLDAVGPTLRVVARSGVGVDNLNVDLLRRRGVRGFNVPDYCGDEVTTHTLALLLALERHICAQDRLIRAGSWGIHRAGVPRRTSDRAVGIVGFGRIGRASARKLQAVYRQVLAHDPYVCADLMASHGVRRVPELPELFAECDAVVLHAALTPDTEHLINVDALASARAGCLLVNTARGRLVDLPAVLAALDDGRLGGFASDVFAPEDPNRDEVGRLLLQRDNVVVSSHRAFLSAESEHSLRTRVSAGIRSVLCQDVPLAEGFLS